MTQTRHEPVLVTMPPDWAEAFRRAASADGLTLSRWLAEAGRKRLPPDVRKALSTPRERGNRSSGAARRRS